MPGCRADALGDQHGGAGDRHDGAAREGLRAGDVERPSTRRTPGRVVAHGLGAGLAEPGLHRRLAIAQRVGPERQRGRAVGRRAQRPPRVARRRRTRARRSSRAANGAARPPPACPRAAPRTTPAPRPRSAAARRSRARSRAGRSRGAPAPRSPKPLHAAGFRRRRGSGRRRAAARARGAARAAARGRSRSPRAPRRACAGAARRRTRGASRGRGSRASTLGPLGLAGEGAVGVGALVEHARQHAQGERAGVAHAPVAAGSAPRRPRSQSAAGMRRPGRLQLAQLERARRRQPSTSASPSRSSTPGAGPPATTAVRQIVCGAPSSSEPRADVRRERAHAVVQLARRARRVEHAVGGRDLGGVGRPRRPAARSRAGRRRHPRARARAARGRARARARRPRRRPRRARRRSAPAPPRARRRAARRAASRRRRPRCRRPSAPARSARPRASAAARRDAG